MQKRLKVNCQDLGVLSKLKYYLTQSALKVITQKSSLPYLYSILIWGDAWLSDPTIIQLLIQTPK